jgi:hypothetical protein
MGERSVEKDAGELAELIAQEVEQHVSLGTSGRWILDYDVVPLTLAEAIVARVFPPAGGGA